MEYAWYCVAACIMVAMLLDHFHLASIAGEVANAVRIIAAAYGW